MGDRDEAVQLMHMAKAFTQPIADLYLDAASRKLYEKWENSTSLEERERAYLEALALKEFRRFIKKTIIVGEQAERELNEKEEKEKQQMLKKQPKTK